MYSVDSSQSATVIASMELRFAVLRKFFAGSFTSSRFACSITKFHDANSTRAPYSVQSKRNRQGTGVLTSTHGVKGNTCWRGLAHAAVDSWFSLVWSTWCLSLTTTIHGRTPAPHGTVTCGDI